MTLRERIIDESTKLFVRNGVKSVRMDDIATRLGVSKRTIYELLGDRETLIVECVRHFYALQEEKHDQRVASACNVVEEFILILEDWEEMMTVDINFMNDLKRFYPVVFERIYSEVDLRGRERLKSTLQRGIADGLFLPGLNLDFTAVALMASINTIFTSPSVYDEVNVSMTDAFKYIVMCFFRGISTKNGIHIIDSTFQRHFPGDLFPTE